MEAALRLAIEGTSEQGANRNERFENNTIWGRCQGEFSDAKILGEFPARKALSGMSFAEVVTLAIPQA